MGCKEATASRKIMVSPASKMFSAISLGVFCRDAPSTSLIIRSRNVSPGFEVIFTLISSDNTRVPPVTAERSPPLSRMTGADSPVIADSSTEATPSITSPSEGMMSPTSTNTMSPALSDRPGTLVNRLSVALASFFAMVSVRVLRSASACALPRPSATASAKLAKTTVNQSQIEIWTSNRRLPRPKTKSRIRITVVSAATTSTTNITGFANRVRGSSFLNEAPIAGMTILGSRTELERRSWRMGSSAVRAVCVMGMRSGSIETAGMHRQMLDHWAECERREEGKAADDHDHGDKQADEQAVIGWEPPGRGRRDLLGGERTRHRQHRHDEQEAAHEHREGQGHVVEGVGGQPGKGAAAIAGRRGEGEEDLAEAMRPGLVEGTEPVRQDRGQRGEAQDRQRQDEDRQDAHLDFAALQLLADIFRRPPDHQPGHEHGDHGKHQHAVEPGADTAEDDLAQLDIDHRDHAGQRHQAVMHGVDRAAGRIGGNRGEEGRAGYAEPHLLAFHIAAGLQRA